MKLISFLRQLKGDLRQFNPNFNLLRIEINKNQLEENIRFFKSQFQIPYLAAVLKSNAYGHGLKEIGQLLDKNENISHLVVDSIMEAKILRNINIKKPIIIVGYVPKAILKDLKKLNVILVVNSLIQALDLKNQIDFPLKVHIKIDTGLHRHGVFLEELKETIDILNANRHLKIEGLMSHLAAPSSQKELSLNQFKNWKEGIRIYKEKIADFKNHYFHLLATAGINYFNKIENNLARIGLGIYGFDSTSEKNLKVKPILSFWAKVVNIKNIKRGEGVGYGFSWIAEKERKIATIACGYYEGVPRYLSNRGFFYYRDKALPIIGRVSMNLSNVDISDVSDLKIEDEVEVFSVDLNKSNSITKVAELGNTIPYEVLVHLSPQIRRIIK